MGSVASLDLDSTLPSEKKKSKKKKVKKNKNERGNKKVDDSKKEWPQGKWKQIFLIDQIQN